ncbi:hypothetical protein [Modestobacter sp. NPDC013298]
MFAGCGIISGSDPQAELAETQAKFASSTSRVSVSSARPSCAEPK